MYRIILCLILNALSMPFSFAITSSLHFGILSKTCHVELQQKQYGKIQIQQNFIKEDCKTAYEICQEWATLHEVKGACTVNVNRHQMNTSVGCYGDCPAQQMIPQISPYCPKIEHYCGIKPVIGSSMERYMGFLKCVRKIEACENGEIKYPSDFN